MKIDVIESPPKQSRGHQSNLGFAYFFSRYIECFPVNEKEVFPGHEFTCYPVFLRSSSVYDNKFNSKFKAESKDYQPKI